MILLIVFLIVGLCVSVYLLWKETKKYNSDDNDVIKYVKPNKVTVFGSVDKKNPPKKECDTRCNEELLKDILKEIKQMRTYIRQSRK